MDFSTVKKITIPEGEVKQIAVGGTVIWKEPIAYVNQVPISIDTDGSIYNKVGYKENVRLSSSGSVSGSAQNGSVTTGFIPFPSGDKTVIRMKGVEWLNAYDIVGSGFYYIVFYDENKKSDGYNSLLASPAIDFRHIFTPTRDSNGIETIEFNQTYGTTNAILQFVRNKAKYFRITAYGKGANFIVTVNEEIS